MPTTIRDLAPELVLRVLFFLELEEERPGPRTPYFTRPRRFFPQYATVSRQWQHAVERVTFASVTLKSTELAYFSEVFTCWSRRTALGTLRYEVVLPTYSEKACGRFENYRDKRGNDEAFTKAVYGLFSILKVWEESITTFQSLTRPMQLHISSIYSPVDFAPRGVESDLYQFGFGNRHDVKEHRYEHSVIKLCKWDDLPTLSRVKVFKAFVHYSRVVEPRSIAEITAKLTSLEALYWGLDDDEKINVRQRQQNRSSTLWYLYSTVWLQI
jgi:hypothetical protein